MIRYNTAKGRREATLGQFPLMSLADARIAAAYFRKEVRDGIDPLLEKQKIELPDIETVDQLSMTGIEPIWVDDLSIPRFRIGFTPKT